MPPAPPSPRPSWWHGSVGYQIYVRSFQDSDGDGVGDLEGIRRRLPYLADLGVDLVWITPFYPSPQADHGYDVADYTGVDPTFGSVEDVDRLVAEAHALGLRVVLDLVPNHTSSEHPWFRAARAGDERYRDYYVWRDPAPDGGPPNNWVSHFGGPAWTLDEASGQYYMHLFLPEQPDLNWDSPAVRDEFDRILAFWFDRGVDGFRIDVAHSLVEDQRFLDNPLVDAVPADDAHPHDVFAAYEHRYDLDQPGVLDVYRRWNAVASRYDAILIGEVYVLEPDRLTRYVAEQDGLHTAFCFPTLKVGWDADEIRETLAASVIAGSGALSWPLSSHDDPRAATRFGGGERGARRQLAYLTLLATLPGIPFVYQGDELGLSNGEIPVGDAADPVTVRNAGAVGRDGSRTPIPWEPGPHLGFSTAEPWLPLGGNHSAADSVATQTANPGSHLNRVRRLLAVRRELTDLHGDAPADWLDAGADVVALRRGGVVMVLSTAPDERVVALPPGDWTLRYGSSGEPSLEDGKVRIPADAAVLLQDATA